MNDFEKRLEELQADVDTAEKLERLYLVPEFKELILDGYFKKESERLVEVLGSFVSNGLNHGMIVPGQNDRIEYSEKLRRDCLRSLEGISNLHTYLKVIFARGEQSAHDLKDHLEMQGKGEIE